MIATAVLLPNIKWTNLYHCAAVALSLSELCAQLSALLVDCLTASAAV